MSIEEKLETLGQSVEDQIDRRGRLGKVFVEGLAISTAVPADGEAPWETAVAAQGCGWHPVQRYQTLEEAEQGHAAWIASAARLDVVLDLGVPSCNVPPRLVALRAPQPPAITDYQQLHALPENQLVRDADGKVWCVVKPVKPWMGARSGEAWPAPFETWLAPFSDECIGVQGDWTGGPKLPITDLGITSVGG